MYNDERKRAYIALKNLQGDFYDNLFANSESFETKYDRDLCEFDTAMLTDLFDVRFGMTRRLKRYIRGVVLAYHDWCQSQGYKVCDDIYDFYPDVLATVKYLMVSSPLHLEKVLDAFLKPVEEKNMDNLTRCYLELAYLGFTKEETMVIQSTDVSFEDMMITFKDPGVMFPAEFLKNIRFCAESEVIYDQHGEGTKPRELKRSKEGCLLRSRCDPTLAATDVRLFKRKKSAPEIGISFETIRLSGLFYRKYQDSLATGAPVSFDDEVRDDVRASKSDLTDRIKLRNTAYRIRINYQTKYEDWKKTFMT